jgi:hypothetical protein
VREIFDAITGSSTFSIAATAAAFGAIVRHYHTTAEGMRKQF